MANSPKATNSGIRRDTLLREYCCAVSQSTYCSSGKAIQEPRFASRLIGEREIVRIHESRSTRPGTWQASKTRSEQHLTESAVLPSEIEQLPDLAGYLKLASSPRWARVQIALPPR